MSNMQALPQGKIAYIAVTKGGRGLAFKLQRLLDRGDIYLTEKLIEESRGLNVYPIQGSLKSFMGQLFDQYDYLICIMATGIVVRSIAPYVESKFSDPAVLVLDEKGANVISLLSGHIGGANEMTRWISQKLDAHPVITTATDVNKKAALDEIILQLDAYVEDMREAVKNINAALVNGQKVGLYQEEDYGIDTRGFINLNTNRGQEQLKDLDYMVYIGTKAHLEFSHPNLIRVIPRSYVLGMGCKKDTDCAHMLSAFKRFCRRYNIAEQGIQKVGSIVIKKDECAMQELAKYLQVPFEVFEKAQIAQVEHLFEGSTFVKQNVGVSCVAEPCAYLMGSGEVVVTKEKYEGITFSLGKSFKI